MIHEKGAHLHVTGHLEVEHEKTQLLVPIHYKVHEDDPPEKHEEFLDELHQKTVHWGERRQAYESWRGAVGTIGNATVRITDCRLQMHNTNDWKLLVAWEEARTTTQRYKKLWHYSTPLQAQPLEDVQAYVRNEVASRAGASEKLQAHKEVFRAVYQSHSAEAARARRERALREAGSPVRPGESVEVAGGGVSEREAGKL